jgi:hypothetical protein
MEFSAVYQDWLLGGLRLYIFMKLMGEVLAGHLREKSSFLDGFEDTCCLLLQIKGQVGMFSIFMT